MINLTKESNLINDRLIRALRQEKLDRTPVWIMRQAGRYLPEYREVRRQAKDFLTLCKTPDLACEVTLQPIRRFDLDAAIIFSDILTIPDAMGLGLKFIEGEGPVFNKPLRSSHDVAALPTLDPETELRYVMDAIRTTKRELANKIPLIGFSGSPWTLATYMIEGSASKQFTQVKRLLYAAPVVLHRLLLQLARACSDYCLAQIAAGVDVIMLFDTWGGLLTPVQYLEFSLFYMKEIVKNINERSSRKVPIIVFTKNAGQCLEEMSETGCEALGLDWFTNLKEARARVGSKVALQGNLDPSVLYAETGHIQQAVKAVLASYGKGSGHIFNLGHGIHPDTDPDSLRCVIQTVQEESPYYHQS